MQCCHLTDIVPFSGDYHSYERYLYNVFQQTIKDGLLFCGKPVSVRRYPEYMGKEEAFYHLTCKEQYNLDDRTLDLKRSERLHWIEQILMNTHNDCPSFCIKLYEKKKRIHLLNESERYLIVLEPRTEYVLLVTAFYIEYDHTLKKKLKDYQNYIRKLQEAPF